MSLRPRLLLLCLLALAPAAVARVLSYAPYSNRIAFPSHHLRTSRWFALIEAMPGQSPWSGAQVVLYDAHGVEEPRVIWPNATETRVIVFVAIHESRILISTYDPITWTTIYLFSSDAGRTWKQLTQLNGQNADTWVDADFGGPFSRGAKSPVAIGGTYPFVIAVHDGLYSIDDSGNVKLLFRGASGPVGGQLRLVGRDRDGTRFLVAESGKLRIIDRNGVGKHIGELPFDAVSTGWITSDGAAYVMLLYTRILVLYRNGSTEVIGAAYGHEPGHLTPVNPVGFFAVPTHDYNGAWMIQRATGKPTTLSRHTLASGRQTFWADVSGPEVEALHTGASGDKLLIQVHRPRAQAERWLIDPALAVWRVGQPAPKTYDELFLNETFSKGFVHLDVDTIGDGAPFVFDSGMISDGGPRTSPSPPGGGGGDVMQEWGVVRASLKQRLVLPGVARQAGAFDSYWLTDVVIHNPLNVAQRVEFQFTPIGGVVQQSSPATMTLAPREIRVVKDVVKSLFSVEQGGGTIFLEPEQAVTATARTYTRAGTGSFGFGMQAIDVFNSANPRFPVSFAGAFPGPEYRTNMLLTDTSGRGTEARLRAHGLNGKIGADNVALSAPVNGVQQLNSLAGLLGLTVTDAGGLEVQPTRGTMIVSVVAMDNRTNDPTLFPPDLASPVVRTIPAIGHIDGAHNSKFRSDVFVFNPTDTPRTLQLEAKLWDSNANGRVVPFTLLPGEARVIRDALSALFGMRGIARLRYNSGDIGGDGVRVTSRTYNIDEHGRTYGTLIPPLNSFQSAGPGEMLEILGIVGGTGFRTNLGLVDLTPAYNGTNAEARIFIVNESGVELDQFSIQIATAGGTQINDIFAARGITPPAAAIVYVAVSKGLIGAYATLTDNVTNDSTYLGASLSAQPN